MRKTILVSAAALLAMAVPALAQAQEEDHSFSLHTRVGLATNLNQPQTDIYLPGPAMQVEPLFHLASLPADLSLAVGPSLQAFYFPRQTDNGLNAGLLWEGGAALRLQGDRNLKDGTGTWLGTSPYLEVNALAANTGNLYRPAFGAALGLEGALDSAHMFWLGTYVAYDHVFQTSDTQDNLHLSTNDVNIFQVGLSLSFDLVKPTVVNHTKVVHDVHTVYVDVPAKEARPAVARLEQVETVYFDWDSNHLRWESNDKLDRMITLFKKHPNARITVEGHASLDGNYDHNVALSSRRTAAVVAYLTAHGVDANRLVSEHFGPDVPARKGDNKSQEGKERNRRVEFQVNFTIADGN